VLTPRQHHKKDPSPQNGQSVSIQNKQDYAQLKTLDGKKIQALNYCNYDQVSPRVKLWTRLTTRRTPESGGGNHGGLAGSGLQKKKPIIPAGTSYATA